MKACGEDELAIAGRCAAGLVAAFVLLAAASTARAATITYAGSLIDLGAGWREATVSKGAFSSTNILGQEGYYIDGGQGVVSTPTYVSAFAANSSVFPGNGSYEYIDNPVTTPGPNPSLLLTGTFNQAVGSGNTGVPLSFTLNANVPGAFQVGLLVDNTDGTQWNDYAIALSSSVSGAGPGVSLTGASFNDRDPDWVFFDVTGAVAGETISIVATAGAGGHVELGGVAFDAVVPEPASFALLGAGILGLGMVRRRTLSARAT